jgi:hypothetical protein
MDKNRKGENRKMQGGWPTRFKTADQVLIYMIHLKPAPVVALGGGDQFAEPVNNFNKMIALSYGAALYLLNN